MLPPRVSQPRTQRAAFSGSVSMAFGDAPLQDRRLAVGSVIGGLASSSASISPSTSSIVLGSCRRQRLRLGARRRRRRQRGGASEKTPRTIGRSTKQQRDAGRRRGRWPAGPRSAAPPPTRSKSVGATTGSSTGSSNDDVLDGQLIAARRRRGRRRRRRAAGSSASRPAVRGVDVRVTLPSASVFDCWSLSTTTATDRRATSPRGAMLCVTSSCRPRSSTVSACGRCRRPSATAAGGAGRRHRRRRSAPAAPGPAGCRARRRGRWPALAAAPSSVTWRLRIDAWPDRSALGVSSSVFVLRRSATLARTRSAPTIGSSIRTTRAGELALHPLLALHHRGAERLVARRRSAAPAAGRCCR